ncbi:hypothetical protein B0H14DRAFT_2385800, partial [Mycena olivaceomarginata]
VVGINTWPEIPGWMVTTPTYMISEKATDVIIAAAHRRDAVVVQDEMEWGPTDEL